MLRILIWGTGQRAVNYLWKHLEMLDYINILAFVDGKKAGDITEYFIMPNGAEKEKISPLRISEYFYDYIVVLSSYYDEIVCEAVHYGVSTVHIMQGTEFYLFWIKKGYIDFKQKYGTWLERRQYDIVEENSDYIWVSWLQGYEEAPKLIQKCIDSIKQYSQGQNFCFVTMQNYKEYVDVPDYLIEKLEDGIITLTFFSDILRLLLLDKYGGLWVDATVFCIGNFKYLYKGSDFFAFRITGEDDGRVAASWFIYSKKSHVLVRETLNLLLQYCSRLERMEHYYIIHYFFRMVAECYEEIWKKVPMNVVSDCYLLYKKINKKFSLGELEMIEEKMPVQKLNRRIRINTKEEDTFYHYLISESSKRR